ncbi:Imm8 family immunity protein [Moritella viscosa]
MIPIILSFDCTDYDPIDSWIFPEPKRVDFWMNFTIGLDQSGGNDFQLHVLTSDMVTSNTSLSNAIVLDCYAWDAVLLKVNAILDQCSILANNFLPIIRALSISSSSQVFDKNSAVLTINFKHGGKI